jgi:ribosome-associated heat shock protein Hsp15
VRIDKLLWYLRIVKTRTRAHELTEQGRIRIDGKPIDRPAAEVSVGQVLSFMLGERLRVLRIDAIPERRGPASEAQACYTELNQTSG